MTLDLTMVGYEPAGSENLSLRLVAGAVVRAGFSATVETAPSLEGMGRCMERAVRGGPRVLGLSLQDGSSAVHALALARLARKRGYEGRIVCGGSLATLQPRWVLDQAKAVDIVVRYEGEEPLIALLGALAAGGGLRDVPSLVTRDFETAPLPRAPLSNWIPLRGERPRILGVPTADVISGRGCAHRCDYCTHAARSALVVRECRDAGISAEALRASGLGRPARRPLDDLADELAALYHGQGVRCFDFVDENPVPEREGDALEWAASLKERFAARGMGPIGLGLMTRADALTPTVVDALADLGLLRTFAGVESGSGAGLSSLGRQGDAGRSARGIALLAGRGVVTLFNSLLLHPDSTVATVRDELAFLGTVKGALFDTVQVRPFVGTALHARMAAEGRIGPGELLPSFAGLDPAIERFHGLLARLQTRVFGPYSPTFRAADLLFSAQLARRFGAGSRGLPGLVRRLQALADSVNGARVEALGSLLERAEGDLRADDVLMLVSARFAAIGRDLDRAARELTGDGFDLARHYRNLAAAAALVFTVAAAPACNLGGAIGDDTDVGDTDADTDADTDTDTDADTDADTDTSTSDCDTDEYYEQYVQLSDLVWGNCGFADTFWETLIITLDAAGKVESVDLDTSSDDEEYVQEIIDCYLELLTGSVFPCLAGEEIWFYPATPGVPN
ncbi:MAG TPA: cobalamin-dependent protein [Polyangia bacterium]|nr:cobalamin-dependent protein [Polyangia bacterium]